MVPPVLIVTVHRWKLPSNRNDAGVNEVDPAVWVTVTWVPL